MNIIINIDISCILILRKYVIFITSLQITRLKKKKNCSDAAIVITSVFDHKPRSTANNGQFYATDNGRFRLRSTKDSRDLG